MFLSGAITFDSLSLLSTDVDGCVYKDVPGPAWDPWAHPPTTCSSVWGGDTSCDGLRANQESRHVETPSLAAADHTLHLTAVITSRRNCISPPVLLVGVCRPVALSGAAGAAAASPLPAAAEGVRITNTPVPQICPEVSTLTYGKYWRSGPCEEAATCHA
ncbi:hypothetical protein FQA47_016013 [Oryzias melastigma]|uniref:Uncharacterized protein n=1 Tax=Oryzias melastigma TaxID=30732 RepID=A0A834L0N1_ORYME|nr:hypothetical protein FQA47_016013 [Oryzias melastigma]